MEFEQKYRCGAQKNIKEYTLLSKNKIKNIRFADFLVHTPWKDISEEVKTDEFTNRMRKIFVVITKHEKSQRFIQYLFK